MAQKFKNDVERWRSHLAAERDAMALYLALARTDKDTARADIWRALAAVEQRHASRWIEKRREAGEPVSRACPESGSRGRRTARGWPAPRVRWAWHTGDTAGPRGRRR